MQIRHYRDESGDGMRAALWMEKLRCRFEWGLNRSDISYLELKHHTRFWPLKRKKEEMEWILERDLRRNSLAMRGALANRESNIEMSSVPFGNVGCCFRDVYINVFEVLVTVGLLFCFYKIYNFILQEYLGKGVSLHFKYTYITK